jgi:hypothetical protein
LQSIKDAARYPVAAEVAALLLPDYHYKVDFKDKNVELTEEGVAAAELALETEDLWDENDPWARSVCLALCTSFWKFSLQFCDNLASMQKGQRYGFFLDCFQCQCQQDLEVKSVKNVAGLL